MKKICLLLVGIVLATVALASSTGTRADVAVDVPIQRKDGNSPSGRPRSPEQPLFRVYLDTDLTLLFISALYDVDEVSVCIENLSSGEYVSYSFDSSEMAVLPMKGVTVSLSESASIF